ncbi:hypothetical protein JHK87_027435 [Glycine soja]|nr:hypothetical protein JHK87_027435 [Glycine soja]
MLWLTVALVAHGPVAFNHEQYNGSLPTLILRPQSWTKAQHVIKTRLQVIWLRKEQGCRYNQIQRGAPQSPLTSETMYKKEREKGR